MATVYLARDVKHDRPVALKVLRSELGAVLGAERFLREIRLTATLQHPHILPLLDSGEATGQFFYVMPYVEGESVRQRLQREGQLPVDDALRLTREVADALDYAHGRGIIHRDIKPENLLLSRGHALVADFGIALAVTQAGGGRLTETGLSLGTPAYMSPEQAMAESRLDGRSDQYSLACVLYEILAGEPPYTGPTAQAIIAKRLSEPLPHLGTLREVPAGVEAAVARALAKSPADRFPSAGDFAAALERPTPQRRFKPTSGSSLKLR
jgi:eukaryotic-like serine/threonine-protein kinase